MIPSQGSPPKSFNPRTSRIELTVNYLISVLLWVDLDRGGAGTQFQAQKSIPRIFVESRALDSDRCFANNSSSLL